MKICVVRTKNETVTKHNFNLFVKAFKECGFEVFETFSRKEMFDKHYDYYFASDLITAYKLRNRRKKYFYWMQGIAPEESTIEGKSKTHYFLWSFLEKKAIKSAIYLWTVSNEMVSHLEKKYRLSLKNKTAIFPCYNTTLNKSSFFFNDKYSKNVFVYAGGLTPWQCFEETIDTYKKIESEKDDVFLLLLVRDKEQAKRIVQQKGIKNYSIDYVSPNELDERLAVAKFGFVIRKNDPVNNVSTPTKISSYLSNGVIPIYTSAIKDFSSLSAHCKYAIQFDRASFWKELKELMFNQINPLEIYKEYSNIFEEYYNDDKYIKTIKNCIFEKINK